MGMFATIKVQPEALTNSRCGRRACPTSIVRLYGLELRLPKKKKTKIKTWNNEDIDTPVITVGRQRKKRTRRNNPDHTTLKEDEKVVLNHAFFFFVLSLEELCEVLGGGLAATGRGRANLGGGLFFAEELEVLLALNPPPWGRRPSPLRQ